MALIWCLIQHGCRYGHVHEFNAATSGGSMDQTCLDKSQCKCLGSKMGADVTAATIIVVRCKFSLLFELES